jgi:hypothetical protein
VLKYDTKIAKNFLRIADLFEPGWHSLLIFYDRESNQHHLKIINYDENPKTLVKRIYFPENPTHVNHWTKQKPVLFTLTNHIWVTISINLPRCYHIQIRYQLAIKE